MRIPPTVQITSSCQLGLGGYGPAVGRPNPDQQTKRHRVAVIGEPSSGYGSTLLFALPDVYESVNIHTPASVTEEGAKLRLWLHLLTCSFCRETTTSLATNVIHCIVQFRESALSRSSGDFGRSSVVVGISKQTEAISWPLRSVVLS